MNYISVTKSAFSGWSEDKASVWAASLAYFTVFSLSPLLLLITSLAGIFLGEQAIQGKLFEQIQGIVGADAAKLIEQGVSNTSKPTGNIIATIIGVLVLILGATGIFDQLQQAFNNMWHVKTKPKAGIGVFIKDKLLSLSMLLIIGFLLAVSVGISFFISISSNYIQSFLSIPLPAVELINITLSFIILIFLFAAMFKILPDVQISFKTVLPGAIITAMLFVIGKFLIGWYIGRGAYTSTYGAAGSLMILLVWVYYSVQLLLLGAEFTKAYAQAKGLKIRPSHNAISTDDTPLRVDKTKKPSKQDEQAALIGHTVIGAANITGEIVNAVKKTKKKTKRKK